MADPLRKIARENFRAGRYLSAANREKPSRWTYAGLRGPYLQAGISWITYCSVELLLMGCIVLVWESVGICLPRLSVVNMVVRVQSKGGHQPVLLHEVLQRIEPEALASDIWMQLLAAGGIPAHCLKWMLQSKSPLLIGTQMRSCVLARFRSFWRTFSAAFEKL